ncbi:bacterio-opsin activator [Sulfolobus acidocaldarius SUSAZ]|nr:bacterio-opsin activator [Sulfolobus acidocaldarius SUSAZ]
MKKHLNRVKVLIAHDKCWTSSVDLSGYTINYHVYPEKGYLRARVIFPSSRKNELSKMKRAKDKGILRILQVNQFDSDIYVDFLNTYRNSIAGLLYDYETLFLRNELREEKELWDFITTSTAVNEIIDQLNSHGELIETKVDQVDDMFFPYLSPSQVRVLKAAFEYGYLDYPRDANADMLAERLNISKVTFLYHLRSAEKKLVEFYLTHLT